MLLFSCSYSAFGAEHKHALMGSHGMVLLYDQQLGLYASHLPLYTTPHDYQIIYKIRSKNAIENLADFKQGLVTVLPSPFDLNRLINGESFSITADFYQGHFERGGKLTISANIEFVEPVIIKKITPLLRSPDILLTEKYFLTPVNENAALVIHHIQSAPSFDAIAFVYTNSLTEQDKLNKQSISCAKSMGLSAKLLREHLVNCLSEQTDGFVINKVDLKYIETKDFS